MFKTFRKYWNSYGGFNAFIKSPFSWLSLLMTLCSYEFFLDQKWLDTPASMLPNLLGFNLASYSVWLAFGNQRLNRILSKLKDDQIYSRYMEVNASFIHFIFAQLVCLILVIFLKTNSIGALFYKTNLVCLNKYILSLEYMSIFLNGFVFFLFFYCLFCMLAAVLGFVGIASGLDMIYRKEALEEENAKNITKQKLLIEQSENEVRNKVEKIQLEILQIQKNKAELELVNLQKNKYIEFLKKIIRK